MNCPKCSGETRVMYSRKQKNGDRRRNYECRQCHYRFLTGEDGGGERFLGQVMYYPPEELARITKNYYQLVGKLTLAKLPPDKRKIFNAALINTKMRLNIQGGKAGLTEGRLAPTGSAGRADADL